MNIKLPPLQIKSDSPFEKDALNREESAEILTQFCKNLDEPYVVAIDSPWGTGKTTFLKMWQAHLEKNKMHSLYFNAWETDFNDDALIALVKEIEFHLKELKLDPQKKKKADEYLQKAKKIGYGLLKRGVPAAIKLATYGLLDTSKLTEDALASIGEEIAKDQFSAYETAKLSLNNFKQNLEKFSKEISSDGPLIFIIDELDRCRPDYAIQVLEKIKHLFSINNLVFILGIDKKQIKYSIETLYGKGMDVDGYLSRFIDFEYNLPEPDKKTFIEYTIARHDLDDFFSKRKKFPNLQYDKDSIITSLVDLFGLYNFSLRDIEHIISQIVIVIKVTPENYFLHPVLLCFLLVIRKKQTDLYKKIREYKISADEIVSNLKLNSKLRDFHVRLLRAYLEISMNYVSRDQEYITSKYSKIVEDESQSKEKREDAQNMLRIINDLTFKHDGNLIDFLVKKIEISYRFE